MAPLELLTAPSSAPWHAMRPRGTAWRPAPAAAPRPRLRVCIVELRIEERSIEGDGSEEMPPGSCPSLLARQMSPLRPVSGWKLGNASGVENQIHAATPSFHCAVERPRTHWTGQADRREGIGLSEYTLECRGASASNQGSNFPGLQRVLLQAPRL